MYGAYYPYLYGRGAARSFHHAPPFQYDRLNVQQGGEAYGAAASVGSASSGAGSPLAHARLRAKDEDASAASRHSADAHSSESEGECGAAGRAQYVSANCVVFTHYSGDVAAVVDEHFSRALAQDKHKESVPLVSRNLPASFFNAALGGGGCAGGGGCGVELYEYDPWHGYGSYGGGQYHAHPSMPYGGLLLGRPSLHQYKPVEWPAQHAPHLDPASYSYPPVPGLEAQVQDSSKDLYWF